MASVATVMAPAIAPSRPDASPPDSLAALDLEDGAAARALVERARARDPFNPVHLVRRSLVDARFGDLVGAAETLQRLKDEGVAPPLVEYLRALYALRAGRADQARSIATAIETAAADFAPAKFLRAETQIVGGSPLNRLDRALRALPTDRRWTASWADLLVKLLLLGPEGSAELVARHADKRVPPGNRYRAALDKALAWVAADPDALAAHLADEVPGTRGEAVLLQCLARRLEQAAGADAPTLEQAVRDLFRIRARHPERAALQQLTQEFLTRHAARLAAEDRHEEALRFVERALHDAPHDLTGYQNRAALFTLMRERGGYADAWAALNAHQYRLLLLGAREPALGAATRTHRLFAQQTRGGEGRGGTVLEAREDAEGETHLDVDSSAIADDPDLLRAWLHHRRAELVFRHLALDGDGRALLLDPVDRDEAEARLAALLRMAGSLAVLVPEEGAALAAALGRRWADATRLIGARYTQPALPGDTGTPRDDRDPRIAALQEEHLATLADLYLIATCWRVQPGAIGIAEDLIEWIADELLFLDLPLFDRVRRERGHTLDRALRLLAGRLLEDRGDVPLADLTPADAAAVVDRAVAELLRRAGAAAYDASDGDGKARAGQALPFLDRARRRSPADSLIELEAAGYMVVGGYLDEARRRLARFDALVDPDSQWQVDKADKLRETLDERRRKGEAGDRFDPAVAAEAGEAGDDARVARLQADVDSAAASWWAYTPLVHALVLAGRAEEAVAAADRAVARCLGRNDQISARGLAIEARGLATFARVNERGARLFAAGAFEPALRVLDERAAVGPVEDYTFHYLRGRCQLHGGQPEAARASFGEALTQCDRPLFLPVLRQLTGDIDAAYVTVARAAIDRLLQDGAAEEAVAEACRVPGRLRAPAAWLLDLARVFYTAAARGGDPGERRALAPAGLGALEAPLRAALAGPGDVDRALAIARLAGESDPALAERAGALVERATVLKAQLAAAAALQRIGAVLAEKRFADTLAALDALDATVGDTPRLRRLRVLALLGLGRFDEADAAVAALGEPLGADLREFVASYPDLALRQRLAEAQALLRRGDGAAADALLAGAATGDRQRGEELAYCRAFALALQGYAARKAGDGRTARALFERALVIVEPWARRTGAPAQLVELYERLDGEADRHVG